MCQQDSCNFGTTLVVSILFGIGIATAYSMGFLANFITTLWIIFGIASFSLASLSFIIPMSSTNISPILKKCIYFCGRNLVIGTIGTIIATIAGLSINATAETQTYLVIIMFLVGTFFSFLIISLVQVMFCIINFNYYDKFECCLNLK